MNDNVKSFNAGSLGQLYEEYLHDPPNEPKRIFSGGTIFVTLGYVSFCKRQYNAEPVRVLIDGMQIEMYVYAHEIVGNR